MNDCGEFVDRRTRKASDTQSLPPYPNDVSLSDVESQSSDIETASAYQAPVHQSKRSSYKRHVSLPGADVELLSDMDINPNGSFSSQFSPSNLLQMSLQSESNSSLSSSTSSIPYSPQQHQKGVRDPLAMSVGQSFSPFCLPGTPSTSGDTPSSSGRSTPSQISAEALAAVRHQMVTALHRIKQLEEQIKAIPVLSVKVNVLKEEKRLLMMQLKAKEHGTKTRTIAVGDGVIEDYDASSEAEFPNFENGHREENVNGSGPSPMTAVSALHFHKVGKLKSDISAKKAIVAPVPRHPVATRSVGVDANIPTKKRQDTKSIGINVNICPHIKSNASSNGAHDLNGHKSGDIPRPAMTLSVHRAVQLKSSPGQIDQRVVSEDIIRPSKGQTVQSAFSPPRLTKRSVSNADSVAQTELSGSDLDAILSGAKQSLSMNGHLENSSKEQSTSMDNLAPHYVITGTNTDIVQTRIMATNTLPLDAMKPQLSSTAVNTDDVELTVRRELSTMATNTDDVKFAVSKPNTRDFGTLPIIFSGISRGVITDLVPVSTKATETFVEACNASTSTTVILTRDQATEANSKVDTSPAEKVDKETSIEVMTNTASTLTDGMTMISKGIFHCPDVENKGSMAEFKVASTECATMTDVVETPIEVEPAIVAVSCGLTESAPPPMFTGPEMVSVATSYEPVEMVSKGTDYTSAKVVSVGTDSLSTDMVSVGTGHPTFEMVSVGTEYTATDMVSVGTEYTATEMVSVGSGHPVVEMVSVETDYEHARMVSVATEYTPIEMVSVGTSHNPQGDMVSVGTTCGSAVELVSTGTGGIPIEMVSVETSYSPQAMISVGTICNSASEMVSEETTYCPPEEWVRTIGVGYCSVHDNFCDRCDQLETKTQGVGECTVLDRVCDHCDNLVTSSRGVCTDMKEMKTVAIGVDPNNWANHIGVGTCSINDLLCDKCSNSDTQSQGAGDCTVTDSLCDRCDNLTTSTVGVSAKPNTQSVVTSAKPEVASVLTSVKPDVASVLTSASVANDFSETVGVGAGSIHDVMCDRCSNLVTRSLGVGDSNVMGDSALNKRNIGTNHDIVTRTVGVGLHEEMSTSCKAVGERDVNDSLCNACELKTNRTVGTDMAAIPETKETCVGSEPLELISEGSGDCTVLDRVCDRCENVVTRSVAIGSTDITRYTFSCGVQAGYKVIHRASGTVSPRLHERGTMTDTAKLQNSTTVGVGKGDVSKYTSGFGVQVSQVGVESATETTPIPVQEVSTMTDTQKESSAIPKSTNNSDSTLEPLLTTMKELSIVKTENVTVSTAQISQTAPHASPTRSRPTSLSSPRQQRPLRSTSPRKIPDKNAPKTPEILELEKRKRHTDDEPLRPPPEGARYGATKITVGLPRNVSAIEVSRRWSSPSGKRLFHWKFIHPLWKVYKSSFT